MFSRNRSTKVMEPLFSVVSPEKTSDLYEKYKASLYPEDKYDDLKYIKKAKEVFDKVRMIDFGITTSD